MAMLPHLLEPNCEATSSGKPATRVWAILKGRAYSSEHVTCSQVGGYSQGQICGREGDGWGLAIWEVAGARVVGTPLLDSNQIPAKVSTKVQLDIKLESRLERTASTRFTSG